MNISTDRIKQKAKELYPYLLGVRRHLHMHPELSFKEVETSKYLAAELSKHGIEHKAGYVGTGLVALIRGKNPDKKCILLRGDMDALPIVEKNDVPYKSVNEGVMHACGHDVHSTCALGAAVILHTLKDEFEGTVKVMFQPGEELLPGGASLMIKAGILEDPKVEAAIALHVFSDLEAGQAGFKSGMYMASTDEIYLTITGKGGHAAMPAEYNNPILVASEILLELNRQFPNTGKQEIPTILAFGKVQASGATNVIPESVKLEGTFRTMNESWRREAHQKITETVTRIASAHNAKYELNILVGYPFLVNDEKVTTAARQVAETLCGSRNVVELPMRMTAEDFAFISQEVPSCFFRLGTGNKKAGITAGVHNPNFNIDETALETGAALMSAIALKLLS